MELVVGFAAVALRKGMRRKASANLVVSWLVVDLAEVAQGWVMVVAWVLEGAQRYE